MDGLAQTSFGELLKALRKRQRLTQQELATRLGVHRNTIRVWECGDYLPETKAMVLELARHLRLSDLETLQLLEASQTGGGPVWYVPYPRNPLFTGREGLLESLHERLAGEQAVALTQSYALHGLGGIGKTHLAVEYIYRYGLSYSAVFWIAAENAETILGSLMAIADLLQLPERQEADQQKLVVAVQRWLNTHNQWLLIWDNVEDLDLLQRFLPATRAGAMLLTTRRQALGTLAQGIELPTMSPEEGLLLLLRRAKLLDAQASLEQMQRLAQKMPTEYKAAKRLVAETDGLPLALDQAGAYLEETSCSVADYLQLFERRRRQLLARRGGAASSHPASVVATWSLSFEQVEQASPLAADLLRMSAFVHPEAIPEELLTQAARSEGEEGEDIDRLLLHEALGTLSAYSLLRRQTEERTYAMHRLVQAVLRESMQEGLKKQWAERAVDLLNELFPDGREYETWGQCERLVSHALVCADHPILLGEEHLALASLLYKAAMYLFWRGQYAQAEPLYQRALAIRERSLGPEHLDVAETLHYLAALYFLWGKYAQAEPLYQRAWHIWEQSLGPEHLNVVKSLNNLGIMYREQGRYAQAEPLLQRALTIREQNRGAEHPDMVNALYNLASLYREQGRYAQAEPLFQRALHIWEQNRGPEHPDVGYPLCGLAELYREQGRYTASESLFQRALRTWEQGLGSEHPLMAYPLNGLAELYREQGRYAQAEPLYQHALHICEQSGKSEHPEMATSLYGLGELYREQGQYEQAEPLYQRALYICEQSLGPEHPDVATSLHGLGELYREQGRYAQAEPLLQRALHILEQQLGPQHRRVALTLNALANLHREQGQYEQAERLCQRALRLCELLLGPGHPETAATAYNLARLREAQDRREEARDWYARALLVREQTLGREYPKTRETYERFLALLRAIDQHEEVAQLEERSAEPEASSGESEGEARIYLASPASVSPKAWCAA